MSAKLIVKRTAPKLKVADLVPGTIYKHNDMTVLCISNQQMENQLLSIGCDSEHVTLSWIPWVGNEYHIFEEVGALEVEQA